MVNRDKKKKKANKGSTFKSYKIYEFHYLLFYSSLAITDRDSFTDYLITKYLKTGEETLPVFSKPELITHMIDLISESKPIIQPNTNRLQELKNMYDQSRPPVDKEIRVGFQTHIQRNLVHRISYLSRNYRTIGEVLEVAIENYINSISNSHYNIVELSFKVNLHTGVSNH